MYKKMLGFVGICGFWSMCFIIIHGGPNIPLFSIFLYVWTETMIGRSLLCTWSRSDHFFCIFLAWFVVCRKPDWFVKVNWVWFVNFICIGSIWFVLFTTLYAVGPCVWMLIKLCCCTRLQLILY
jgi:hypothetical protein